MVPVQSVQYVTQQVPVQTMALAQPFCDTCNNGLAFGTPLLSPQLGYLPPVYQPAPFTTATIAPFQAMSISTPQTASAQVPVYQPEAQTVQSRSAAPVPAPDAYETVPAREVPMPKDEPVTPARKTSMFKAVPSAATVWQSRNSTMR